MASTIVFIFLLDYSPDNINNKSLATEVTHDKNPIIQKCDHTITDPLLQVVSRELDVLMIPKWMVDDQSNSLLRNSNNINFNTNNAMNATGVDSVEITKSSEAQSIDELLYEFDHSDEKSHSGVNEKVLEDSGKFEKIDDKINEHLVAIFESLSNVTAQTCGGTLLAPHWVLTAASCVNLLSNLYDNSSKTEESVYTIIVNATDPLTDGTAHNVTEIHLHPQPDVTHVIHHLTNGTGGDLVHHIERNLRPDLALMKIQPQADVKGVEIFDTVTSEMEVTVYGWAVFKDESSHETMRTARFFAHALSPVECAVQYNITGGSPELCLRTSEDNAELINQISWGGPVVSDGALCAVSRADGRAPLAAWPLASHSTWIHAIIHEHDNMILQNKF